MNLLDGELRDDVLAGTDYGMIMAILGGDAAAGSGATRHPAARGPR